MPEPSPTFQCDCCGDATSTNRRFVIANGNQVCVDCRVNETWYCDICDERYPLSDDHTHDDYDDGDAVPFGGSTAPNFATSDDSWPWECSIGYELEFFTSNSPADLHPYGALHDDGSINQDFGSAVEFASVPLRGIAVPKNVAAVCGILNDIGAGVNASCGLHVHVGVRNYTDEQRFRIRFWWRKFERALFLMTAAHRTRVTYCKPVEQVPLRDWLYDRYFAMNLQSFREHGTYEFRLFAASTDAEYVLNCIAACAAFVEWAAKTPHTTEISAKAAGDRLKFLAELSGDKSGKLTKAALSAITRNPARSTEPSEEEDDLNNTAQVNTQLGGIAESPGTFIGYYTCVMRESFNPVSLREQTEAYWLATPVKAWDAPARVQSTLRIVTSSSVAQLLTDGFILPVTGPISSMDCYSYLHQYLDRCETQPA